MTSMIRCPDCGAELREWRMLTEDPEPLVSWKFCTFCDWDERRQLAEKMRQEVANGEP